MTGKGPLEQSFSNSFVENKQEDITKTFTLARKMIDSN